MAVFQGWRRLAKALGLSRHPSRGTLSTMKPSEVFPGSVRRVAPRVRAWWRRAADVWPLTALGMALGVVRQLYEDACLKMAEGFSASLVDSK